MKTTRSRILQDQDEGSCAA